MQRVNEGLEYRDFENRKALRLLPYVRNPVNLPLQASVTVIHAAIKFIPNILHQEPFLRKSATTMFVQQSVRHL